MCQPQFSEPSRADVHLAKPCYEGGLTPVPRIPGPWDGFIPPHPLLTALVSAGICLGKCWALPGSSGRMAVYTFYIKSHWRLRIRQNIWVLVPKSGESPITEGEGLVIGEGDLLFGKSSILPWFPLGGSEFSSYSPSFFGFKRKPRCAFLLVFCCSYLVGHKPSLAWMTSVTGQKTGCSSWLCWRIFNKDFPFSVFQFPFSSPLQFCCIKSLRSISPTGGTPQPLENQTWNIKGCTAGHWDGALVTQPGGQEGKPPNQFLSNSWCKGCVNSNSILGFFSPVSIADVPSMFLACYFQGVIKFKCCLFLSHKKGMLEPAD